MSLLSGLKKIYRGIQKFFKNIAGKLRGGVRTFARYTDLSWLLLLLGTGGAIFFGVESFQKPSLEPNTAFSLPIVDTTPANLKPVETTTKKLTKSEPTHIKIPAVGIDSAVRPVGKKADGSMETPGIFEPTTGWYKHGPTPGEIGPSIIVGHVDTYKGPSIFYRLKDLKQGDIIEVARKDGQIAKFKVTGLQQFDQSNFPTDAVYGNIDHAGIRLITCGGTYDRRTDSYSHNTVVFGELV